MQIDSKTKKDATTQRRQTVARAGFAALADLIGRKVKHPHLPVVCVQGLGFVGAAMAVAVANAYDSSLDKPFFNVIGVDLPSQEGSDRVKTINAGKMPFNHADKKLTVTIEKAYETGNLLATTDPSVFSLADVVIVDVNLDVIHEDGKPGIAMERFRSAIQTLGRTVKAGSLIIIETTVPPGTCEKIVAPEIERCAAERGFARNSIHIAHSPERVMPGDRYYDSIVNYWRVYSGVTVESADTCEGFLSKVINVADFPLIRLASTTASESAKILENSYRATTIAFIEEWGRFAEAVGFDLFDVIDAIRVRPTHSNIRQPGFGVGGYCLTKDPLFAELAAKEFFGSDDLKFPFSTQSVLVNKAMPLVTLDSIQKLLGGLLKGKTILLLGVSYREDVSDTRNSPSEVFVREARKRGCEVICHDPLVGFWPEMSIALSSELPDPSEIDAIVFAVAHKAYQSLDFKSWLNGSKLLVFDANNVLTSEQREMFRATGCRVASIGRGGKL